VEAATTSVLLLVEPLSVIVMAMIFLHQPLDVWHILGGTIILAAGVLVAK
jgi:drug/metabolite transporter (DMT)-like permease